MRANVAFSSALLLASLCVAYSHAEPPPAKLQEYANRSRAERPAALVEARAELTRANKSKRISADQKDRIAQRAADIENPFKPYYGTADFKITESKIGDVGWVREKVDVHQVITGESVQIVSDWGSTRGVASSNIRVAQALRGQSYPTEVLTIRGVSTAGIKDGDTLQVDGVYERTASGLELADLSAHAKLFLPDQESRTWTTDDGQQAEGVFGGNDRGKIKVWTSATKFTELPLAKLSDADREFVRKRIKQDADAIKQLRAKRR